ncbi:MAG TPA: hypothetical protein PKD64_17260 [Pirellulaceae bacterium]|nr:hypothetical protein [Pirellulaceae bacterium]HMO93937.1 hypothetical protein [Pirellulaceae bacterium]HMP69752.1 hypothetical protein [Pirellulaceae bacterium]
MKTQNETPAGDWLNQLLHVHEPPFGPSPSDDRQAPPGPTDVTSANHAEDAGEALAGDGKVPPASLSRAETNFDNGQFMIGMSTKMISANSKDSNPFSKGRVVELGISVAICVVGFVIGSRFSWPDRDDSKQQRSTASTQIDSAPQLTEEQRNVVNSEAEEAERFHPSPWSSMSESSQHAETQTEESISHENPHLNILRQIRDEIAQSWVGPSDRNP